MQRVDTMNNSITVGATLKGFVFRPVETVIRRWNWKAAALSACVRGALFFSTNIGAGLEAAVGAMMIESAVFVSIAGFYGGLIESMRRAHPAWAATMVVTMVFPAINHTLEFAAHSAGGTKKIGVGVLISAGFSILSASFNLFAMRRGVLIVGEERRSLLDDLRRTPRIAFEFVTAIPRAVRRILRSSGQKARRA